MQSVADLTTSTRRTTGDVPPPLVGASTTVLGTKMYLFGGRLVSDRRMTADIYAFDMETFVWTKIPRAPGDETPLPRYFHSTEPWKNFLVLFGGMANDAKAANPDALRVLNDVRLYDTVAKRWVSAAATNAPSKIGVQKPSTHTPSPSSFTPAPRYAHLACVTSSRLFILGGQDIHNEWVDEVLVYDLVSFAWIERREAPVHCGAYRSVALAPRDVVRYPKEEMKGKARRGKGSVLGPPGTRFRMEKVPPSEPECTATDALVHLPYSADPTDEHPSDIVLFSNWNFSELQREFAVISPRIASSSSPTTETFTITDKTARMTGSPSSANSSHSPGQGHGMPPGLRFPTGAICGDHLLIAGTDLERTRVAYVIWALHLPTLAWSRIDAGSVLGSGVGSWCRAVLYTSPRSSPSTSFSSSSTPEPTNKLFVFGNRAGNLGDDYQKRQLTWMDVAIVDLEAFGIYQPPRLRLQLTAQELGLAMLEEGVLADFEIICEDGRRIRCSRKMLEERWPWFKTQREAFVEKARIASEGLPVTGAHVALPIIDPTPTIPSPGSSLGKPRGRDASQGQVEEPGTHPDPRLTPRALRMPEPYGTTLAFLQYLYAQALITPLQHASGVLAQLLLLASTYEMPDLREAAKHAMHRSLSGTTSVGVYEVATLCGAECLQVQALKAVMVKGKTRSRSRSRNTQSNSPSSAGGSGSGSRSAGGSSVTTISTTRPRGQSDASYVRGGI